jgi:hypothetical protein
MKASFLLLTILGVIAVTLVTGKIDRVAVGNVVSDKQLPAIAGKIAGRRKRERPFPRPFPKFVSCGRHEASTCAWCPQGNGESWCKGDCTWKNVNRGVYQCVTKIDDSGVDNDELAERMCIRSCAGLKSDCGKLLFREKCDVSRLCPVTCKKACTDTPDWSDGRDGCGGYRQFGWCKDNVAKLSGALYNFPEKNCCGCGKEN